MTKIKIKVSKWIWKLCGKSPEWGNRIMDILGYKNYCKVMEYQRMD